MSDDPGKDETAESPKDENEAESSDQRDESKKSKNDEILDQIIAAADEADGTEEDGAGAEAEAASPPPLPIDPKNEEILDQIIASAADVEDEVDPIEAEAPKPAPSPSPEIPAAAPPPDPYEPPAAAVATSKAAKSDDKLMLVLAYLGIFSLVPYLMKPDDRELRWHAKQGLALFLAEIALALFYSILLHVPILNFIVGCLGCVGVPLTLVALLVMHAYLIIRALDGGRLELPLIGGIARLL